METRFEETSSIYWAQLSTLFLKTETTQCPERHVLKKKDRKMDYVKNSDNYTKKRLVFIFAPGLIVTLIL
jgi:hypothetical protein